MAMAQSPGNSTGTTPAVSQPKFPEATAVQQALADHFAGLEDYQAGDLVAANDVTPIFAKLKKLGWTVADEREITGLLVPDSDPLVRQLRTTNGRKFMRKITSLPGGYDRLDRLRKMPQGEQRLREMIQSPGGEKLVEYMTSTPEGRNLGRSLSQSPSGKDFNKPTGRLYTAADVERRLLESYAAERVRREARASTKK